MRRKKLVSVCIPVLNEIENIRELIRELEKLAARNQKYNFEWVFSDNGSTDGTWELLKKLKVSHQKIRAIRFSENVGYQESIIRNYGFSRGDALINYDADMQDPIEMVEEFLIKWEKGYQLVYGVRIDRVENRVNKFLRNVGYSLLHWVSNGTLRRDVGDFRLIDAELKASLLSRNFYAPYVRGIVSNLGFKEIGIPYMRDPRRHGTSKFSPGKVIALGAIGVMNFSTALLRVFLPLSVLFIFLGLVGVFWVLYLYLTQSNLPRGFSTTQIMIFFSIALNASFFAISGNYLLRIHHALVPLKKAFILDEVE